MDPLLILGIYAVAWWIILLMVLPIGVKTAENPEEGHAVSAPTNPRLGKKMLATTLLSIPVTWFVVWLIGSGLIDVQP
jgi:predicted secreted protein